MQWVKNKFNLVLQGEDFYISYNPDMEITTKESSFGWAQILGELFGLDHSKNETALVKTNSKGEDKIFYILHGDFRTEYELLFRHGFKACYKFYLSQKKKYGSNWSTIL